MADRADILKQNMRRACLIYLKKQAEQLPSEKELKAGHVFSEYFNTKMYDAMHPRSSYRAAQRKRSRRMSVRSLIAAALLICVLISGASLVPAILMQKPVSAAMIVEQYPSENNPHIKCERNPWAVLGAPRKIEEVNLPTYIPEGFKPVKNEELLTSQILMLAYEQTDAGPNRSVEIIRFRQCPLYSNLNISLYEVLESSIKNVSVASNNGVIYQRADNGYYTLCWNDGSYLYTLSGEAGEVSQEELIQMAESVQKAYDAPVQ